MMEFYKKYYKTAFDIALLIVTVLLIMWLFSYLYKIAAPIFLAFVVFAMVEPMASRLHRWGIRKSIATAISLIVFVALLMGVIAGAGYVFTIQIASFIDHFDDNAGELAVRAVALFESLQGQIPPEIIQRAQEYIGTVAVRGAELAQKFLVWLMSLASSISVFTFNFVMGIILAYFLSLEIGQWKRIAREKTPNTFKKAYAFLRENVFRGLGAYLKAQLILISVTFVLVFATLLLLGVKNAFAISVISAIVDLLPMLGISAVFIPWIIYLLFTGKTTLAICLSVLLAVILLARQILEPKITGQSLGVSAFTMLSFMVISLSLFGVAGVILSPVLLILIKALYDQGYLQKWIRRPEDYD